MATRFDVSAVAPQGGYVAKQCPVRAQWDLIQPCAPLPPSPAAQWRMTRGREFEADLVRQIRELRPDAVLIRGAEPADREAATSAAIAAGAAVIIGGRATPDLIGRRVGEPDLLIRECDGRGYRPVDIKHHRTLDTAPGDADKARGTDAQLPAICSALDLLTKESAAPDPAAVARKRRDDLLQLAHYQRMLEAAGCAALDGRYGGIIGVDEVVTWYDLDAPIWRTPASGGRTKLRSTMAVYDFEFDFRLDILAAAAGYLADETIAPLVVPVRIGECAQCPWWSRCGPELHAGAGSVSLLPGSGWRAWRIHRDHGVGDRAAVAALDYGTATLVAAGVDVRPIFAAVGVLPDDTPVSALIGERKRAQLAKLAAARIEVLGDARRLSARTAAYCAEPMRDLPEQIDQARAALGPADVYRRRGVDRIIVSRGDIEVDIDMENTADGVYLWGTLVTNRCGLPGVREGYRAFYRWDPVDRVVEAEIFTEFWQWLTGLRSLVAASGRVFRAYCYNAAAETTHLRRIGAAIAVGDEVAAFVGSRDWIDLLRTFDSQLLTGSATGLKNVAPLSGFAWCVSDPGGAEAILRYETAVRTAHEHQEARQSARDWILAYNRDDVAATLSLREWLDQRASASPAVSELAALWAAKADAHPNS